MTHQQGEENEALENPLDKMDTHKKNLLQVLQKSLGVVTTACKAANIPRSTFYNWCKDDVAFKALVDDITEQSIDFAESQLFKLMNGVVLPDDKVLVIGGKLIVQPAHKHHAPDTTAIIFYLKTKGKKRGYVERTELTGADGDALNPTRDLERLSMEELRLLDEITGKMEDQSGTV